MINTELTNADRIKYSTFAAVENLMHYSDRYKKELVKIYKMHSYLNKACIEEKDLTQQFIGFNREQDNLVYAFTEQSCFAAFPKVEILISFKDIAIAQYCYTHKLKYNGDGTNIKINAKFTWNDLYHQAIQNQDDFESGYLEVLTYYYNKINKIVLSDEGQKVQFCKDLISGDYDDDFDAICRYQDMGMESASDRTRLLMQMFNNHIISLYDLNKYVAPNVLTSFRKYHCIQNALGLYVDECEGILDNSKNDLVIDLKHYFPNCDTKHFNKFNAEMMNRQNWELNANCDKDKYLSMTELLVASFISNVLVSMSVPEWCQREQVLFTVTDWNYLSQEIFPQFSKDMQKHLRPILQMALDVCKLSMGRLEVINTYTIKGSRLNKNLKKIPNYVNKIKGKE